MRKILPIQRLWLVAGVWLAAVVSITAGSVALDASLSTSALLLVMCAAPWGLVFLMRWGPPPPTVAEVLHAVDTQNDRRR